MEQPFIVAIIDHSSSRISHELAKSLQCPLIIESDITQTLQKLSLPTSSNELADDLPFEIISQLALTQLDLKLSVIINLLLFNDARLHKWVEVERSGKARLIIIQGETNNHHNDYDRGYILNQVPIAIGTWGGQGGSWWDDGVFCTVTKLAELDYPDEYLTSIHGHYGSYAVMGADNCVRSLSFESNRRTYGPFGQEEGTYFSVPMTEGMIVGFYGRSSHIIDAIAVVLELFALLLLVSTDWTDLYLPKQKRVIRQAISHVRLRRRKPVTKSKIHKFFGIDKILQHQHMTCEPVTPELKDSIFTYLKEKFDKLIETKSIIDASTYQKELKNQYTCRGAHALRNFPTSLRSVDVEFDRSIIIWHIARILNYHADRQEKNEEISRKLSQYMLYLLVMRSSMLPLAMGIGKIRYQDTCAEATTFFQEPESVASGIKKYKDTSSWAISLFKYTDFNLYEKKACKVLLNNDNIGDPPVKVKGERTMSVLFDACRLASDLQNIPKMWEVVTDVWMEMLAYAASHCRGTNHAQQLGRGGELLTHVWLLMAHFGLTEQFQISHADARVELSVK
ncbi:hypothetical protein JCGZ_04269 [Jatropha curcas]|uniref:Jacalin-type lectin domain-containing protein n=1 Tax=Jatropha curcas TaxID=180498 RepID=A0A067L2L8_JATCU|nr:hypothetical protein JCGZ_04269 [Jatropha curcas]